MSSIAASEENVSPSNKSMVRSCNSNNMSKRGAAREKIQQYYFQLTEGCGRENCSNANCASSAGFQELSSNDAAAKAFNLYKCKSALCEKHPSKIPRTAQFETPSTSSCANAEGTTPETSTTGINPFGIAEVNKSTPEFNSGKFKVVSPTKQSQFSGGSSNNVSNTEDFVQAHVSTLEEFCGLISEPENDLVSSIREAVWTVFSSIDRLNRFGLHKEKVKALIKDEDKDVDEADSVNVNAVLATSMSVKDMHNQGEVPHSSYVASAPFESSAGDSKLRPTVDVNFIRCFFQKCSKHSSLETLLVNAISYLVDKIDTQGSKIAETIRNTPNYLNMFVTIMEYCALQNPETLETAFPNFCHVLGHLPVFAQSVLVEFWSEYNAHDLQRMVESLQQLITVKVVSDYSEDAGNLSAHEDKNLIAASKCLNIIYYASILGGKVDKEVEKAPGSIVTNMLQQKLKQEDQELSMLVDGSVGKLGFDWTNELGQHLHLSGLDSVQPKVPFSEFVNESLNGIIKVDTDYADYRVAHQRRKSFSFLQYPFLLNTVNKTTYIFFDNRVRMYSERRRTIVSSWMQGSLINPYLKLRVRRSHIIDDTLIQLEVASENSSDLKKQVFVEFDGEEGVDEGGVSKEFFQLVIEQIFNPENGMFIYDQETGLFLFNRHSFESLMQYKLIGIVLGLAIYNNCILDIHLPSFVYKKLLGRRATLYDMKDCYPVIYKSLIYLLEHDGDVEEDIMITFKVQYKDVYSEMQSHELKDDGENIPVTNHNRQEYVDLYVDWLLNSSIAEQFNAFRTGFDLVVNESPLTYLLHPHELELVIRGSEDYDFDELERSTEYSGGFSRQSQTIKDFWAVVHELNSQEKRTLLQFTTGSDRAPVGGLSKLKMIIARNGPDSERLPSAHTCFNVILLPDYANRAKLKERLLKAIKYSKGFGML